MNEQERLHALVGECVDRTRDFPGVEWVVMLTRYDGKIYATAGPCETRAERVETISMLLGSIRGLVEGIDDPVSDSYAG